MKIPRTFKLGSRTWRVDWDKSRKHYGATHGSKCRIRLSKKLNRSDEETLHTFLHELTHAITYTAGMKKLNADEAFTDAFSNLLGQALETMK